MLAEIVPMLRSKVPEKRMAGWQRLHTDFALSQVPVSTDEREMLVGCLLDELQLKNTLVWTYGITVLAGLLIQDGPIVKSPQALIDWLWNPFQSKSACFGLTDPDYRRRDEVALIRLSRHLCEHLYPLTDIHFMKVNDPSWKQLLFKEGYQSMRSVMQ